MLSFRGSSQPRDQICVFCIGRQVLTTSTTWEAPCPSLEAIIYPSRFLGFLCLIYEKGRLLQVCQSSAHSSVQFSSVQLLSHVRLFVTPWTAACQASLSITNSWSLLKVMSIKSVMPSNHLILYCPLLLLPSSGDFPRSQFFTSGGQSIRVSASASVLPMSIQD